MQKRKLIAALVATVAMVQARAASLSEDRLVACAGMTDSAARLACYDREVAPLAREVAGRARASSPAAPTPAHVATPSPAAATTSALPSFGQEQLTREQRPAPEKEELTLHARLSSQKSVGAGRFNLYLDNGQVWRHEDSELGFYLKDGDAITIKKGALGSYKLSRDTGRWRDWILVRRVQ
ncbi:MAG TPA: hypothetical protein VGM84_25070 [Steroidobacteraceae bacterium]|jgi:hypothetical protein